jgi:sulfatase maturation enzyme AslB (radical SAM superfamily)
MNPKDFYVGEFTDKPIVEGSGVNVIYFTNKCNLACTYCYEDLEGRPPQIMTQEDIRNSIDSILARENPNDQTLFVLFGGEVTLEWENALYFMDYAYSKKKNVHFNISTNGIRFLKDDFLWDYKKLKYNLLGLTSLDISFDGIGNGQRVTKAGTSSTPLMLKIFNRLNNAQIPFRLRYTMHSGNINNLYDDIKLISQKIKPKRIITSVAWDTLDEDGLNLLQQHKDNLRKDWFDGNIKVPVCELFCDACDGCGARKDIKTYYSDEGNVTTYKNYESAPKFNDFKEKERK